MKKMTPPPSPPSPHKCTLVFCTTAECLTAVWHMADKEATARADEMVLASFRPKVPVAAHKLSHNCGRVEMVRGVSNVKTFYFGWAQFLSFAHKAGRASVAFEADVPGRAVLLAAINGDSLVLRCKPGSTLDLSDALCVAVVPGASHDFDVKHFEIDQFLVHANRVGAGESFEEGRSPGTKSPAKSPVRRASTRTDMLCVQGTPTTKEVIASA